MSDRPAEPLVSGARGFISYAHDDAESVCALTRLVLPLARALGVEDWTDAMLRGDGGWSDAVANAVATADVFVLCLSPAYLASPFIWDVEYPAVRARAEAGHALVIPVIVAACSWWGFVGDYPPVPARDGKVIPIEEWEGRDVGIAVAAAQIVDAIRRHFDPAAQPSETWDRWAQKVFPDLMVDAPGGDHRISPDDIERAVKTVVAGRAAKSGA